MRRATQILSYSPRRPREENKYHYWIEMKPDRWLEYVHTSHQHGDINGRPSPRDTREFQARYESNESSELFSTEALKAFGELVIHEN